VARAGVLHTRLRYHGTRSHAVGAQVRAPGQMLGMDALPRDNPVALCSPYTCQVTKARAATLHLPHGPVPLPIFMPVATQASLKGLTPDQLEDQGCRLCLNNTYHLYADCTMSAPGAATSDIVERPQARTSRTGRNWRRAQAPIMAT
jgi:hypothetical protein